MESKAGPQVIETLTTDRDIIIPAGAGFWRRLFAFSGPAFLVSVGYMDPGNWATDIEGGSRFNYSLLWVILGSSLIAIFLQIMSAKLGIATGKGLAENIRDKYPRKLRLGMWAAMEFAMIATDLAEFMG